MLGKNKLLIVLMVISLLAAIPTGILRHKVEMGNRRVEMVADFDEFYEYYMGLQEEAAEEAVVTPPNGENVPQQILNYRYEKVEEDLFAFLKQAGFTSLSLSEITLEKLDRKGKASSLSGRQILDWYIMNGQMPAQLRGIIDANCVKPNSTYIFVKDKDLFAKLKKVIEYKLGPNRVWAFSNQKQNLIVAQYPLVINQGTKTGLYYMGLGLDMEQVEMAISYGFGIVPRYENYPVQGENIEFYREGIRYLLGDLQVIAPHASTVVFSGMEVLGFPKAVDVTVEELAKNGLNVGIVEFSPQKGITQAARGEEGESSYRAVRVHSISAEEMAKITPYTARQRLLLAVRERNIRLLYLRPFPKVPLEENVKFYSDLQQQINGMNHKTGMAKPFAPWHTSALAIILMSLGSIAAGLVVLRRIVPIKGKHQILLLGFGLVGILGLVALGEIDLLRKGAALLAAISYPVIATTMLFNVSYEQKPLLPSLLTMFIGATAITLCGALLVVGLLGDISFTLKLDQFSGVKLSLSVPILLAVILYFLALKGSLWRAFIEVMNAPVKVYAIVIGAVLLAGAAYMLLRSGNEGASVSSLEMMIRDFLGKFLGIRPRTKEVFIGHPALMITAFLIWMRELRYALPFLVLAMIGQVSMVNTFSHLHTPLWVSLVRTFYGIFFGGILGLAAVYCINYGIKFYRRLGRE